MGRKEREKEIKARNNGFRRRKRRRKGNKEDRSQSKVENEGGKYKLTISKNNCNLNILSRVGVYNLAHH